MAKKLILDKKKFFTYIKEDVTKNRLIGICQDFSKAIFQSL